ncbi:hypothetical protein VN97_g12102 [Penicillium thymicola]|uniref:Uncharacterized protein n=1 Tax=Penicillium thymicola TaxID=293382 RepID=A0AAI9X2V8_PENTH|nr:hypothetical protein VN97_g12102 [Penicillium thymicola]
MYIDLLADSFLQRLLDNFRQLILLFEEAVMSLTLFHDTYLPGMWICRAVVGCSGVGQVQVFGGQKYLNSRTPIGLKI